MNSKLRDFQKKIWFSIAPKVYKISPISASKLLFLFAMKQKLNLKDPKTFNEKIQWLKLFWQDERIPMCGDKYDVRKYVKECGVEEILNPIYGVYRSEKDICFDNLPNRFVIKGTHGCGYNLICIEKDKLNLNEVRNTCKEWLNSNYAIVSAEPQYERMEPKIIVEKFIDGKNGNPITDYKIFCFNGKAEFTMVCEGRTANSRAKYYFYNNEWEVLGYNYDSKDLIERGIKMHSEPPKSFEDMIKYAEILSKPFPFVRVDFYDVEGNVILGEMTFTPCGGIDSRLDKNVDRLMGDMIKLPKEKILYNKL